MNIAVFGASGHLGQEVVSQLLAKFATAKIYAFTRAPHDAPYSHPQIKWLHLDLSAPWQVQTEMELFGSEFFDEIYYLAADLNLDMGELRPEIQWNLNWISPLIISMVFPFTPGIYMSTASVLGDTEKPRNDRLYSAFANTYIKSKSFGEEALVDNWTVVRSDFVSFRGGLVRYWYNEFLLDAHPFGYTNVYFNPVSTKFLASTLIGLVKGFHGLVHVAGEWEMSKFDLLQLVSLLVRSELGEHTISLAEYIHNMGARRTKDNTIIPSYGLRQSALEFKADLIESCEHVHEKWS